MLSARKIHGFALLTTSACDAIFTPNMLIASSVGSSVALTTITSTACTCHVAISRTRPSPHATHVVIIGRYIKWVFSSRRAVPSTPDIFIALVVAIIGMTIWRVMLPSVPMAVPFGFPALAVAVVAFYCAVRFGAAVVVLMSLSVVRGRWCYLLTVWADGKGWVVIEGKCKRMGAAVTGKATTVAKRSQLQAHLVSFLHSKCKYSSDKLE